MHRRVSSVVAGAVMIAAAAVGVPALGAYGGGAESSAGSPCLDAVKAEQLRCPNLRMGRPRDMYIQRIGRTRLLHATSSINSVGLGPAELHGIRVPHKRRMRVHQRIYKRGGGHITVHTKGRLAFYPIPGQGHYWKFQNAARFQIWTVHNHTQRGRQIRTGPKFYYCFRDLFRTHPSSRSPRHAHYPGCSQNAGRRTVTLGTSVGWSDVYPANYHEQYINITGLRGCFAFVLVADPKNHIRESDETDNRAKRFMRFPSGRVKRHC